VIIFPEVALLDAASNETVKGATPLMGVAAKFAEGVWSVKSPSNVVSVRVVPNASSTRTHVSGGESTLLVVQAP